MKNKKRVKSICSNLMLLFCAIIFFVSVYKLAGYLTEYKKGEQEYSELSSAVTVSTEGQNKAENKSENPPKVDFAKLQAINPDVIGWIMIEGTVINYPIVQGMDNEYYLHKTFRDKTNQGGTIFLDAENQENFTSDNSILYGHNLKTGKMFGSLRFYEDKEYWKDHPYIWVITKKKSMKYQIFSSYRTEASDSVYTLDFGSRDEFSEYLEDCVKDSYYDTGVTVGPDDDILTLSTCTSDSEEGRRVVQAKMIYEEENKNEQ